MKKLILHLMCAILVMSSLCTQAMNTVALTEPTIAISDETCNPGNEISLSVSLDDNPGIMYLSVTPKCYDAEGNETDYLTVSSVENGELFSIEKGINLVFDSDSNVTENGNLCTLNIAVVENTPYGEYTVELILRECYNSSEQDVEVEVVSGIVTVEKPHTPARAVIEDEDPATCTESGSYDEVVYCDDCGEELSRVTKTIPKKGHTIITVPAKSATCTATGLTAGKKCKVCDEVTVAQKTIAKVSHKWNSGVVTKKATYDATGVKTYTCTVCKKATKTETIKKLAKTSLAKAKITVKDQTYSGKEKKPGITVKLGSKTLKKGTDYTVSYKNNKKIGKATVTIEGIKKYKGKVSKTFKINPKKVSSLKLKSSKKKQLTVSWKKDSSVTGYEILYATNSKFTKGKKTVTVKSAKTVKKTIKSLKSKKTYYVKVRAYKTVSGKKYYSAYTSYKKLKIK